MGEMNRLFIITFFCALRAFCKLQTMCIKGLINNCYEISRQLFVLVIRQFILDNVMESAFSSHHEHDFVNV